MLKGLLCTYHNDPFSSCSLCSETIMNTDPKYTERESDCLTSHRRFDFFMWMGESKVAAINSKKYVQFLIKIVCNCVVSNCFFFSVEQGHLTVGAIAGIVTGSILFIVVVMALCAVSCRHIKNKKRFRTDPTSATSREHFAAQKISNFFSIIKSGF